MYIYFYIYTCLYIYIYIYIHELTNTYTNIHNIYTYIRISTLTVYTYTCIYIWVLTKSWLFLVMFSSSAMNSPAFASQMNVQKKRAPCSTAETSLVAAPPQHQVPSKTPPGYGTYGSTHNLCRGASHMLHTWLLCPFECPSESIPDIFFVWEGK